MATTPVGYPYTAWSTEQLSALISEILGNNDFDGATITGSTINSSAIGGTTPAAGTFTTLSATNTVTLSPASHNVAISPSGTGTVTISPAGALTVNPTTASTLDNVAIGGTTPKLGTFTYVGQSAATGLSAAGSSRTDATQLAKAVNVLSTVAGSTGVILPAIPAAGAQVIIVNGGANPVTVYGSGSNTIDGVAAATGVTQTNAHRVLYIATSTSTWISVTLGATTT